MLRKSNYANDFKYYETKRKQSQRYRERTGSGKYPRKTWSEQDDRLVLAHKMSDRKLAKIMQRSANAIQKRRSRLRKMVNEKYTVNA